MPAHSEVTGAVAPPHPVGVGSDTSTPPEAVVERRILSHEHREIEHLVGRIETTAEMAGNLAASDLVSALRSLLDAMEKTLLRHIDWEEDRCFPEMDRLAATPWATRLLRFQHQQVRQALERLETDWQALQTESDASPAGRPAGAPLRAARADELAPRAGGGRGHAVPRDGEWHGGGRAGGAGRLGVGATAHCTRKQEPPGSWAAPAIPMSALGSDRTPLGAEPTRYSAVAGPSGDAAVASPCRGPGRGCPCCPGCLGLSGRGP